ncbi:hypothetical protein BTN45_14555 [Rhizobium sp. ZX09]|nr:hypothetical protein BTN45_14555 [Rhizobium sp. ZX09]HCJ71519.1 hypothetical protein [Agrobacterium sp.]
MRISSHSPLPQTRTKNEHICLIYSALFSKQETACSGIYSFSSKYKNTGNTFYICLPRETQQDVYFGLILFFKCLEIARR